MLRVYADRYPTVDAYQLEMKAGYLCSFDVRRVPSGTVAGVESRTYPMRCVVIANGDSGDSDEWGRAQLKRAALVVAADGGATTAVRWGREPDMVVGDLDSLGEGARRRLTEAGVALERHEREKDQTDTEIALVAALRLGATSIELLGALGGERLDHALANVLLLALPALRGVPMALRDERHTVRLVRGGESTRADGELGDVVTLLPLTARVSGITTTGLRYALREGTLVMGASRGVSNELTGKRASVHVGRGMLLMVSHHQ